VSAVSLLLDLSLNFGFPGTQYNVPAVPVSNSSHGDSSWDAGTLGLRLIVPVNSRLSFYALSGGGGGGFSYPVVTGGANPTVSTNETAHFVFVFGGGADVRLSRRWSLRMDVRDLVTGRDLSGAGRHHVLPSFGVALHF
jgi:opacity protein-like surface antigen